jgi:hypothetical protein
VTGTPATWRCPVCEGVNHGGRVCSTCGETLPAGFVPEDATRRPAAPAPTSAPRVVAAPRAPRHPSPEEIFGSNPFR